MTESQTGRTLSRPRRRRGARTWTAGVLGVVLLAVSGCATIPTEGPVVAGQPVGDPFGDDVRALVSGPTAGQTPGGIVTGFLAAAQGAADDYEVARTFLTSEAASNWRPAAQTVVYRGGRPEVSVLDSGQEVPGGGEEVQGDTVTARLSVEVVAAVDDRGRYLQQPNDTSRDLELTLQRAGDQWRISGVDDLALLSQDDFAAAFRNYPVHFLDPTRAYLVPEVRWFPYGRSTATRLVRELLAGPSDWLAPAVETAFPSGTALAPPAAVVVRDNAGVVDLTEHALEAGDADLALMRAQLESTVQPLLGVNRIEIRVDGGQLDDTPDVAAPRLDPDVPGTAVLVQGGSLVQLDNRTVEPVTDLPDLSGLDVSHPGVAPPGVGPPTGGPYAVLTRERSELRLIERGTEDVPDPVVVGSDLSAPSIDWRGWAWTSARANAGFVSAVPLDGTARQVETPWLTNRQVTSLRVSRDGARVVVASTDQAGVGHLDLAGVVRDRNGAPQRLVPQEQQAQALDLTVVEEVAWVDQDEVVVLGRTASETDLRVWVLTLSGPVTAPLAPLAGVTTLACAKGERTVLAAAGSSGIWALAGSAWVQLPDLAGAREPAFPG